MVKGTKSLKPFNASQCTRSLLRCEVAFKQDKYKKENSTRTFLATEFGGGKKKSFSQKKLTHWCCPCSSLGRLAANIQLLVTFISYRALLFVALRRQRLFLGLRVEHAAARSPSEAQPIVDKVPKHFSMWAMPPGILSACRLVFTQRSTKLENSLTM